MGSTCFLNMSAELILGHTETERSFMNSKRDQKPGFQNGLESVQVKRKEIPIHLRVRKRPQKRQRKRITMRRKRRRRKRKRRNNFVFRSMPRLKSNPNNFKHSMIESLLLYQRLVNSHSKSDFLMF